MNDSPVTLRIFLEQNPIEHIAIIIQTFFSETVNLLFCAASSIATVACFLSLFGKFLFNKR